MPTILRVLIALLALGIFGSAHAVQRAYVSAAIGTDANQGVGCTATQPCRWFTGAHNVVDPGGEIVAMDTGAYGALTVSKSVAIIAAPGAYAGMTVFSGSGVTMATGGISVTLRGLTINSLGGTNGINVTAGSKLSVENCVITNFPGQGLSVTGAVTVRVVDSLFRDNATGISLRNGATTDISNAKLVGNAYGIWTESAVASTTVTSVSDTVVTGSTTAGITAQGSIASGIARSEVIRTTVSNGGTGVAAQATGGTGSVTLSESMVTGNTVGLSQSASGGTSTFYTLVNNTVSDNTTPYTGTITTLLPQ
ncbi:hypothetical protein BURK2_00769 [Burkholderiales bacterium]|nr:MAG: hypothetical protein F9K47_03855 [Burkholderiales bacterium]CAG0961622.1 hypothetical protein BURK2_00769 [Burkholderiales bacterium]